MLDKKVLTIKEVAQMGARAQRKKYGKRQLLKWAKLGGRPKKSTKAARSTANRRPRTPSTQQ